MNCPKKKFTAEEDAMLLKLVKKYGACKWDNIALSMPGRKGRQCRDRYMNYLNPTVKKDEWTLEEDSLLIEKFKEYGPKWTKISKFFQGRTGPALKNRWNYRLSRIDNQSLKLSNTCQEMDQDPVFEKCIKSEADPQLILNKINKADWYSMSDSINLPPNVELSSLRTFNNEAIVHTDSLPHPVISSKMDLMPEINPTNPQNSTQQSSENDNVIDEIFGNLSHEEQIGLLYDCYDLDFADQPPAFIF